MEQRFEPREKRIQKKTAWMPFKCDMEKNRHNQLEEKLHVEESGERRTLIHTIRNRQGNESDTRLEETRC